MSFLSLMLFVDLGDVTEPPLKTTKLPVPGQLQAVMSREHTMPHLDPQTFPLSRPLPSTNTNKVPPHVNAVSSGTACILQRRKLELGEVTCQSQLGWQPTSSLPRAWLLSSAAQALPQQDDPSCSWTCAEQSPPHLLGFQFMRARVSRGIAALLIFPPKLPGVRHPLLSVPAHLPTWGRLLCAKYSQA